MTRATGEAGAPPPLLEVRRLRKRFGALQVLDRASVTVAPGELVALVGDNGAGKSTLAKCVARAIRPDGGDVLVDGRPLGPGQDDALRAGIGVVWQDLSLCENLDTVANLFLGRERGRVFLSGTEMQREAHQVLARTGVRIPDVTRPVASLSGGQRQALAVARALGGDPRLLILDEPTASLGRAETTTVLDLLRQLRTQGTAMLLITHQLDDVFDLADRVVVLRHGRVVADVSPLEVHPDDIVALQSGIEVDSTASRQLRRLSSLVDQLSEVEPSASLPLVVSAMTAALGQEKLCVHLLDRVTPDFAAETAARPPKVQQVRAVGPPPPQEAEAGGVLRRSAAVGLPEPLAAALARLPPGEAGGPIGLAAATGEVVVSEDVRIDPEWTGLRWAAQQSGVQSSWAAPIVSSSGVLGTLSGYGDTVGRPRHDQLELISLYARYAATAIEQERLLRLEVAEYEAETLRRSQRMHRDFLSRLNHELRTPLTAIHGCADSLRQPDVRWDERSRRRFLDTIATESDRMRRLVADLLDVSAMDAGVFRIHPDWCDLSLVLEASVACVGSVVDRRTIMVRVDDELEPVWADHDRLEQVFVNLLENAIRHTPPSARVWVEASSAAGSELVHIRVSDDGPGIRPDAAERLFSSEMSGRSPHTGGLGLPIARGIALAHGGDLSLEPASHGTTVLVTLPSYEVAQRDQAAGPTASAAAALRPPAALSVARWPDPEVSVGTSQPRLIPARRLGPDRPTGRGEGTER